jgi:phenylalanyl-tRNA synthetase beta chain
LIESAYFNPSSIRSTSKNLMLSTDSSYRFERGTDPSSTVFAAERAAQLIAQLGNGKIAKGILDVYSNKIKSKEVKLRFKRIDKVLGYSIEKNEVIKILKKLGLNVLKDLGESLEVVIPTYRPDIEREVDLIEEVARIAGYDEIPTISKISITLDEKEDESVFTDKIRDCAISLGLHEMINNPLIPESYASVVGNRIEISNPQSKDMAFLRTSLAVGSLSTIAKNIHKGEKDLSLFEIGNIFNRVGENEISSFDDFTEIPYLLLLITGKKLNRKWYTSIENYDFYDLKGLVNSFFQKILLDNVLIDSYNAIQNSIYEYYFTKSFNNAVVGFGGKVNKKVLKQFDIEHDVFCFEADLTQLRKLPVERSEYSEPLKFPKILRDFAFIFDKSVSYEEVKSFIVAAGSGLLKSVELFDLFESKELGENKKSMAFGLEYYDKFRTLTEDEVDKDFQNLISSVVDKFNATLRGN